MEVIKPTVKTQKKILMTTLKIGTFRGCVIDCNQTNAMTSINNIAIHNKIILDNETAFIVFNFQIQPE